MLQIKTVNARGHAARAQFKLAFRFKKARVAVIHHVRFLALKISRLVGRDEIAHLIPRLDVLVHLPAARLDALPDDQVVAVPLHVKHAAVRHFQHRVMLRQVQRAAVRPRLREHPAHALVEINHHPVAVLPHDGKTRQQPPRRQIRRHHQPLGGFIHVHAVGKQFELHNFSRQPVARRRLALRNHGRAEQIILAETVLGNREQKLIRHLQRRRGGGIVVRRADGNNQGDEKHCRREPPQPPWETRFHRGKMPRDPAMSKRNPSTIIGGDAFQS